jgi:phosphate-selective porin OprO and OprP
VTPAGHRSRLEPQGYYCLGPFGLFSDYGLNEEGFQKGTVRREIAFRAFQVQATYILTGEKKSFGSPTPKHPYGTTSFGGGGTASMNGNQPVEKVFTLRFQINFGVI